MKSVAAKQSAKYGFAAVLTAVLIIGAALATMSFAKMPAQPIQTSQISTGQSSAQNSNQTAPQNGTNTVSTVQLGTSSASSTQSETIPGQVGNGILSFYLTDAPSSISTLKYLLVNVSSFAAAYQGNVAPTTTSTTTGTTSTGAQGLNVYVLTVPSTLGMNVNLSSLQGQSLPLGGATLPAGNISSIVVDVSGAKAFYTDGTTQQIPVVADGQLPVPIQFGLQPNGSTDLTIDLSPSMASISEGLVLAPVIHAIAVESGLDGTTTLTVTTTESLPPTTSTETTTQTVTAPTVTSTVVSPTTQTVTSTVTPPTTTQTVTTTTGTVIIVTSTYTSPTTQTVTSTTTVPPTTTTVTSTTTASTTTTTTAPSTTTSTTSSKTTTSTATTTTTVTWTSTVTTTVTSTKTHGTATTSASAAPAPDSAPAASPASAGSDVPIWLSSSFAFGALFITGVTVLALPRFRRGTGS